MSSSLVEFKRKREEWLFALDGDDQNSVSNQLTLLVMDSVAARVLSLAFDTKKGESPDESAQNPLLAWVIPRWFAASQLIAIRKLAEPCLQGRRGVYSLVSVVEDMLKHQELLTRENFFLAQELEPDLDTARRKWHEFAGKDGKCNKIPRKYSLSIIEHYHELFDGLCDGSENSRNCGDRVSREILGKIIELLKSHCETIKRHADKFVAHAATTQSRNGISMNEWNLTYGAMWKAEKTLCSVFRLLMSLMIQTHIVLQPTTFSD